MKIIYRTFDGKEFDNEADACYHESVIRDDIKMWTREGQPATQTIDAFVLYLENEDANKGFFALAREQKDTLIRGLEEGEDYGLFYWDDCIESYHWIDEEELSVLMVAFDFLKKKHEEAREG